MAIVVFKGTTCPRCGITPATYKARPDKENLSCIRCGRKTSTYEALSGEFKAQVNWNLFVAGVALVVMAFWIATSYK